MIIASKISKRYDNKYVLKNFNYKFNKGLYLIIGKSGKGKTTLLNILSLDDLKKEGKILVSGNVFYLKDKENLVNDLTVKEHFKLFEKINDKKIIDLFEIKKIFNKKVKKLSLGERQLVLLTLALNCNEENLILDEPLSALSKENLKKACDYIEKESFSRTIILSTHNEKIFNNYKKIDLHKLNNYENKLDVEESTQNNLKKLKFSYLMTYFKKTIIKKVIFALSLLSTIFSFLFLNNTLKKNFDEYLSFFKTNEGMVVAKENTIHELNENIFYEIIKKISLYVRDYNASYYNSLLYDYDLKINGYYIDNAFVFSSVKYIEENLRDNEIILGLNHQEFCINNNIGHCDKEYIKTLLINKELENFKYKIKQVFDSESTVILSNKKFMKVYENNEYEEYYFDINKENEEKIFEIINNEDFLQNFEFILIGENETTLRYKVEIKEYKYFKNIEYKNYIVCLDKGYNCQNYLNHFNSLIAIDSFSETNKVDMKITKNDLSDNEILISSILSKEIDKKKGDVVIFYFKYNEDIKKVPLFIKDVVTSEEYIIYQNSEWSFNLFKDILNFNNSDLRIKNILIYEDIKEEDYEDDDLYNEMIKEFRELFIKMKKSILYISLGLSVISIVILVLLEIFQNKFKREYFRYLKLLNVKKNKYSCE